MISDAEICAALAAISDLDTDVIRPEIVYVDKSNRIIIEDAKLGGRTTLDLWTFRAAHAGLEFAGRLVGAPDGVYYVFLNKSSIKWDDRDAGRLIAMNDIAAAHIAKQDWQSALGMLSAICKEAGYSWEMSYSNGKYISGDDMPVGKGGIIEHDRVDAMVRVGAIKIRHNPEEEGWQMMVGNRGDMGLYHRSELDAVYYGLQTLGLLLRSDSDG